MSKTKLFAQPYNLDAEGFYFESYEEYLTKSQKCRDAFGLPVEEFEIQFIDGDLCNLFSACNINQANLGFWFSEIGDLEEYDQAELFYRCKILNDDPEEALRLRGYEGYISQSCARELIDECGLLDGLSEELQCYFDVESYARNLVLNGDITEFRYEGTIYIAHGY